METKVFKTYVQFLGRKDKNLNGVGPEFAEEHPDYVSDNKNNIRCWECLGCIECKNCKGCKHCTGCKNCKGCKHCTGCKNCTGCDRLYAIREKHGIWGVRSMPGKPGVWGDHRMWGAYDMDGNIEGILGIENPFPKNKTDEQHLNALIVFASNKVLSKLKKPKVANVGGAHLLVAHDLRQDPDTLNNIISSLAKHIRFYSLALLSYGPPNEIMLGVKFYKSRDAPSIAAPAAIRGLQEKIDGLVWAQKMGIL